VVFTIIAAERPFRPADRADFTDPSDFDALLGRNPSSSTEPPVLEFLIAHLGAITAISVSLAAVWSLVRFRCLDVGCVIAAFAGAFGVYYAMDEWFGLYLVANNFKALGAGAFVGCLTYDILKTGLA
jgi:hypothetical protein